MIWLILDPATSVPGILCLVFVLTLIKVFHKLWWTPTRIQRALRLQGIDGPSYRFIHGSSKQILSMQSAIMRKPLSSSSHDIFSVVQPHIHSWTKIYGNIYFQWYGAQAQLIVSEPGMCTEILNDKQGVYHQRKSEGYLKKLFGDGLALSEGEKWAKLRKLANHTFHSESLKSMIPAMISSVETTLERWKMHEGKEIEVFEEFKLLTCDVISKTAFGSSYLEGNNFFEMLEKLMLLTFRNSLKFRFPLIRKFFKTSDEIEAEKVEKGMWKCIMEVIKKRQAKAMSSNDFGSDFLGVLLKAHHDSDEKRRISIDNVVDECKTFYLGGFHTTTSLLAWTVYLLALHTDWQEEARKEVFQLFGKENPKPDAITKLKIMDMIMNECLRLYTPVVSIGRRIEKEVKLGNIVVPANVELFVPNLGFHHDPQFWGQDANLFKPERFAEGVAKATNMNSTAFLPFGKGPRNCIGSNFATAEAKIAMSMILQRYSFTLSPGYVHSPFQFLVVRPRHGVQVILHPL